MGCGSSSVGVEELGAKNRSSGGGVTSSPKQDSGPKPGSNGNAMKSDQIPVAKPVAFDVTLDGQDTELLFDKKPPKRLQLEPLDVPRLTAEELAEKQRQAEEKREKMLQKRANAFKKSSKRRQEFLKAKEFGAEAQEQLDPDQQAQEVMEVKELDLLDDGDNLEIEKDENFNASDVVSLVGDDKKANKPFSGGSDIVKQVQSTADSAVDIQKQVESAADSAADIKKQVESTADSAVDIKKQVESTADSFDIKKKVQSAVDNVDIKKKVQNTVDSTIDSVDTAFQRQKGNVEQKVGEFFDS